MQHKNQNGISEDTLLKLFFQRYGKALIKEAFLEFLMENELMITSRKEPQQKLLTTDEAAKYLAVNRHTIYEYMKMGLPSFRISKAHKFRLDDLEAFVKARITQKVHPPAK